LAEDGAKVAVPLIQLDKGREREREMEHPFHTRRAEFARATRGAALAADVLTLAAMDAKDVRLMTLRRDPEVANADAREALARHGGRLGLLIEDLDALLFAPGALLAHVAAWAAFVAGTAPLPEETTKAVETCGAALRATRDDLAPTEEARSESSSYSDYSDSDTDTTATTEGATTSDESDDASSGDDGDEPRTGGKGGAGEGGARGGGKGGGGGRGRGGRGGRGGRAR
jgi:hypothetical protein